MRGAEGTLHFLRARLNEEAQAQQACADSEQRLEAVALQLREAVREVAGIRREGKASASPPSADGDAGVAGTAAASWTGVAQQLDVLVQKWLAARRQRRRSMLEWQQGTEPALLNSLQSEDLDGFLHRMQARRVRPSELRNQRIAARRVAEAAASLAEVNQPMSIQRQRRTGSGGGNSSGSSRRRPLPKDTESVPPASATVHGATDIEADIDSDAGGIGVDISASTAEESLGPLDTTATTTSAAPDGRDHVYQEADETLRVGQEEAKRESGDGDNAMLPPPPPDSTVLGELVTEDMLRSAAYFTRGRLNRILTDLGTSITRLLGPTVARKKRNEVGRLRARLRDELEQLRASQEAMAWLWRGQEDERRIAVEQTRRLEEQSKHLQSIARQWNAASTALQRQVVQPIGEVAQAYERLRENQPVQFARASNGAHGPELAELLAAVAAMHAGAAHLEHTAQQTVNPLRQDCARFLQDLRGTDPPTPATGSSSSPPSASAAAAAPAAATAAAAAATRSAAAASSTRHEFR